MSKAKRLPPDVRVLIQASGKPASELAAEYGVSVTTARRWKSRDDVADRSSRPKNVRKALTQPQELEIVRLWHATKLSVRKLLAEVRKEIAQACSHGALQRCLEKHGLIGHGLRQGKRTNVPVRPGSRLLMNNGRAYPVSKEQEIVRVDGASSYTTLSSPPSSYPSPTRPLTSPLARRGQPGSSSSSSLGPSGHSASFGPADLTHPANWPSNVMEISDPSDDPAFPPCFLEKSVDFVVFNNLSLDHLDAICDFLTGIGLKRAKDGANKDKRWGFHRVRRYDEGADDRVYVYYRPISPFTRSLWVRIMQPTRALLETFATFFEARSLAPIVIKCELSFDFFSEKPELMFRWLKSITFLKSQRTKAMTIGGTYYLNDNRKSSIAMKCYNKERRGVVFTRLELRFNKGLPGKAGIRYLLNKLEDMPLKNWFSFLEVDVDHVERSWAGSPSQVAEPPKTRREKMAGKMLRRVAESWLRTVHPEHEGLMPQIEFLKSRFQGLPKYERYLRPIAFNDLFCEAVSKLRFLP